MLNSADNNTLDNDGDARLDVPALADSHDSPKCCRQSEALWIGRAWSLENSLQICLCSS